MVTARRYVASKRLYLFARVFSDGVTYFSFTISITLASLLMVGFPRCILIGRLFEFAGNCCEHCYQPVAVASSVHSAQSVGPN